MRINKNDMFTTSYRGFTEWCIAEEDGDYDDHADSKRPCVDYSNTVHVLFSDGRRGRIFFRHLTLLGTLTRTTKPLDTSRRARHTKKVRAARPETGLD